MTLIFQTANADNHLPGILGASSAVAGTKFTDRVVPSASMGCRPSGDSRGSIGMSRRYLRGALVATLTGALLAGVGGTAAFADSSEWPLVGTSLSLECSQDTAVLRADQTVGEGVPTTLKLTAYELDSEGQIDFDAPVRNATQRVTGPGEYTLRVPVGSVPVFAAFAGHQPDGSSSTVYGGDRDFSVPADCPGGFLDVPLNYQFFDEISWMAVQGITTGYEVADGVEYRPFGNVTRDAMAAFLYRYAGSPAFTAPAVSPFVDVPKTSPFYKEIAWLVSKGISTGWNVARGKEFRPFAPITRDAMAAFLYRFTGATWEPSGGPTFTDVPATNAFYKEIAWMSDNGISTGWSAGNGHEYRPFANITRDAMAAFLYRYNSLGHG